MRHGWSMRCLWQGQREKLRKGCQRSHLGKVLGAPRSEDVQKENTSVPVVPQKAVAEVSILGNCRRGDLLR